MFFFGSAMTVPMLWGLPADVLIAAGKVQVNGRLLRAELANYSVNGQRPTRLFYEYDYGGRRFQSHSDLLNDLSDVAHSGAALPVEVASAFPTHSRIQGSRRWTMGPWSLFVILFPAAGVFSVFRAVRFHRRQLRAFVYGVAVVGRITFEGEDVLTKINRRHPYAVAWAFSVGGESFRGKLTSMRRSAFEGFVEEAGVIVLYDQSRPQSNTVYIA